MDSWLLKLLSRDMNQETWKQKTKINQQTMTKNNRKVKVVRNITPTMDHYPMGGGILGLICHDGRGNGWSITWVQGCIGVHSRRLSCIKVRVVFERGIDKMHLCRHDRNYYYSCRSNISLINLISGNWYIPCL